MNQDKTKALLIASTGGHLAELVRLAPMLDVADDSVWVTFRSPQSESLLAGRRVVYVPYVRPRDWRGALRAARRVSRLMAAERFDLAVSTGAAIAVTALAVARLRRVPSRYIESVSRVDGPSLTGRMLSTLHAADLFTQHPQWAGRRWRPHASVFEAFRQTERPGTDHPRLFVTLGTIEGFRFDRMIDAVLATGLADDSTVWQLGSTTGRDDLPGTVLDQVPAADFTRYARSADVVVTHAGVGSLLGLLELGILPVLVVRRHEHGEHVDDHQEQIAAFAAEKGVAIATEAEDLTADTLIRASHLAVEDAL